MRLLGRAKSALHNNYVAVNNVSFTINWRPSTSYLFLLFGVGCCRQREIRRWSLCLVAAITATMSFGISHASGVNCRRAYRAAVDTYMLDISHIHNLGALHKLGISSSARRPRGGFIRLIYLRR